jgi:hypothetical protein
MKVTKHYEKDFIILYASEGNMVERIMLDNEQQMRRLGECLKDLARTGAKEVQIIPKEG